MADALIATDAPVVELRRQVVGPALPAVHCDDDAIARLAARHFQERGFHHLAFCGRPEARWSDLRCDAFRRRAEDSRPHLPHLRAPRRSRDRGWGAGADRCLYAGSRRCLARSASSPATTSTASRCSTPAGEIDLPVPERVAVLGVDNDVVLCELADPPLSSVDQDLERIGCEAAALLDRLMAGGPATLSPHRAAGRRPRLSTDIVAIDDPVVAENPPPDPPARLRGAKASTSSASGPASPVAPWSVRFKARTGRDAARRGHDVRLNRIRQLLHRDRPETRRDRARRRAFTISAICALYSKSGPG